MNVSESSTLSEGVESGAPRVGLSRVEVACVVVSILCVLFSLWAAQVGFNTPILANQHSWRQAQTALTAQCLKEGGPFLRYETPVLGPPWSVPFEFPLYQWMAAKLSNAFSINLELSGRLLSLLFFYACLLPLYFCLAVFEICRVHRMVPLSLFAISPYYIFWSHAFLVESLALFLGLAYLGVVVSDHRHKTRGPGRRLGIFFLIAALGSLAGVVKVTTFVPFLCAGVVLALLPGYRAFRHRSLSSKDVFRTACLLTAVGFVPFLLTTLWTQYADSVKMQSPATASLTSKALVAFNFGTMAQKLSPHNWYFILRRDLVARDGIIGIIPVLVAVLTFAAANVRWRSALICAGLFLLPIAMFYNLHLIHNYYDYANGLFLVLAVSFSAIGLLEGDGARKFVGVLLFALLSSAEITTYFRSWYFVQQAETPAYRENLAFASLLQKRTSPIEVVLIDGMDWSPEVAYLSHRKAVMVAEITPYSYDGLASPAVQYEVANLGKDSIASFIVCGVRRNRTDLVQLAIRAFSLNTHPYASGTNCDIYFRTTLVQIRF